MHVAQAMLVDSIDPITTVFSIPSQIEPAGLHRRLTIYPPRLRTIVRVARLSTLGAGSGDPELSGWHNLRRFRLLKFQNLSED